MEYGLIGGVLGHSYSKPIHERLADYDYELQELAPDELGPFLLSREFKGINVTIPYKKDVIPYLDGMDEHARAIGAVNTIVNRDGRLYGYNTDCPGFLYMMHKVGVDARGKKALVLGTGGAAQAVLAALRHESAAGIVSVSRTGKGGAVTYEECVRLHADADLIVNTTPVGMYPEMNASPLDLTPFTRCQAVLDVVYNPAETLLTAQAKSLGMAASTGLIMLVAQAKYSCELFLGAPVDDKKIDVITEELSRGMVKSAAGSDWAPVS